MGAGRSGWCTGAVAARGLGGIAGIKLEPFFQLRQALHYLKVADLELANQILALDDRYWEIELCSVD